MTILWAGYAVMGFIVAGFRVYNVIELARYLENFEYEIIGGEIKFIEMILKTILGWPLIIAISIINNRRR